MWLANPVPSAQSTCRKKTAPELLGPAREPETPTYLTGSRIKGKASLVFLRTRGRVALGGRHEGSLQGYRSPARPISRIINLCSPALIGSSCLCGHMPRAQHSSARAVRRLPVRVARGGVGAVSGCGGKVVYYYEFRGAAGGSATSSSSLTRLSDWKSCAVPCTAARTRGPSRRSMARLWLS